MDGQCDVLGDGERWDVLMSNSLHLPAAITARHAWHRQVAGYSIVEMVLAVALIALVVGLGAPMFATAVSNMRVRQTAESIRDGLQTARNEAVKRNAAVAFNLTSASGGGWTVTLVSDGSVIRSRSTTEGGNSYVTASGGVAEIDFNNLGLMTVPAVASVTLAVSRPDSGACEADGGSVRCLSVIALAGGQVRMCDPRRASPDPQAC
jgi:type IV fimbrial biogenesis protein FimT